MPKTRFSVAKDGFKFANSFENVIFEESPFGRVATRGRCGGMAFAVLDHFYAGVQVPSFSPAQLPETGVPPDAHPLARYIYRRQLDSFMVLSAAKYMTWSLAPDDAGFLVKGVSRWTKEDEWRKLCASIDIGKPCVLGLIRARDLNHLGDNHQVVAYGYDYTPEKQSMVLHIYDVNYPGREIALLSDKFRSGWLEDSPNLEQWRGWFVQDYAPHQPPQGLDLPITIKRAIDAARRVRTKTLQVSLDKVTFHNDSPVNRSVQIALRFDIEGESWRWPARGQRMITDGSTFKLNKNLIVSAPADGALTISARLTDETRAADLPGYDAFEFFNLDNDARAGVIQRQFTAADKWGKGSHSVRSTGQLGGFTLEFTIT
jgi:hypothetical protein